MDAALTPPVLTMPDAEAAAVRSAYADAGVILEYGSGGSTVIAAANPGATVFSVESDADWLQMMRDWFAANPPAADLHLVHGDIGPTGQWGKPANERAFKKWSNYPLAVWDRPDFRHPDVVLIDGRFRLACILTVAFRISRPVTVLFDDYVNRPTYHEVETLVKPVELIGRMARFDLTPQPLAPDRLHWFVQSLTQTL